MASPSSALDHARHTAISDPGRHRDLLIRLPKTPDELSAVARNMIVHYRASPYELPDTSRNDINARWLEALLDIDHGATRLHSTNLGPSRNECRDVAVITRCSVSARCAPTA